ncbi:MAG: SEC-C metal-binding domain-containing protein [Promethearchaeota archaeon]
MSWVERLVKPFILTGKGSLPISQVPSKPIRSDKRAGRNEACPCGSGKKFKKCCL